MRQGIPTASAWSATGTHGVRRGGGHDHVDFAVVDQVAGHLGGPVGVGLAVGDLMVIGCFWPSPHRMPVAEGCPGPAHAVLVGDAEGSQAAGERRDETDLDLTAGLRGADGGGALPLPLWSDRLRS